jgi:hypothetical protein
MTSEAPHASERSGRAPHGPTWPWALGSLLLVALVLVVMLAGRALVSRAQQGQQRIPAPSAPPLGVAAVAHPAGGVQLLGLDQDAGRLAVLTSREEPASCPPVGACPAPARPDAFALLDGTTGATISSMQLTGMAASAADASQLLVDSARHKAYAVSAQAVVTFSTLTGAAIGSYPLANDASGGQLRGAVLTPDGAEMLVVTGHEMQLLDTASGQVVAQQALPGGLNALDGPVLDADGARCFVLATANGRSSLLVFDTTRLRVSGEYALPAGARLGPLDATHNGLYILGGDGTIWRLLLTALRPGASTPPLMPISALYSAQAFGANGTLGHSYVAGTEGVRSLDTASSKVLAALPLHPLWSATQPLPVDARHGLLYVLAVHGSVVILHDGAPSAPLSAATAAILARAALATLLSDPNQDPPFVSAATFPLAAGSLAQPALRTEQHWIHFSDRGWQGPYPGTASTSVVSAPSQPGAYTVTFSISWQQLFTRQHTWICLVAPDGSVQLQSDQGDAVP